MTLIKSILKELTEPELADLCSKDLFTQTLIDFGKCKNVKKEIVDDPKLQMELIKMFVDDQAVRDNIMDNIVSKYKLDKSEITEDGPVYVDEQNRIRLKEIFKEFGFPTRKLVGRDAMDGIFWMIQHSDADEEWQKSQLINVEMAVRNKEMDGRYYAYFYDGIKVNGGEKQLYGTQFSKVIPKENIVELAPIEDERNLDLRRREMGMEPIKMYREFMLKIGAK